MPRRSHYDEMEERAWDKWYNSCHCDTYIGDDDELTWPEDCDYCQREKEWYAAQAAEQLAKELEQQKLRDTGFYTEITTLRRFNERLAELMTPEWFDARVKVFKELFETLIGYEAFLATQPKYRSVIAEKVAEAKSKPSYNDKMADVLSRLEGVLAALPARADFKA